MDGRKKRACGDDAPAPTGTRESSHVESCRVTSIFSLWARNSVPMPWASILHGRNLPRERCEEAPLSVSVPGTSNNIRNPRLGE